MRSSMMSLLARVGWFFALALAGGTAALAVANGRARDPLETVSVLCFGVGFSTVGALVASRHPDERIGWVLLAFGVAATAFGFSVQYAFRALVGDPGSLPGGVVAAWVQSWALFAVFPAPVALLLLLFPTGRLPSPRWRPLAWAALGVAAVAILARMLEPGEIHSYLLGSYDLGVSNPTGVSGFGSIARATINIAYAGGALVLAASVAGLVVRLRRAVGEERQQLRWFAYAGALGGLGLGLDATPLVQDLTGTAHAVLLYLFAIGFALGVPAAAGIAILRHHLYDIDLVINKTLVYGLLATLVAAVYVAVVVGIGSAVGASLHHPNLGLSLAATAVVAVAFEPARRRVQRLANRVVFGNRLTPYEAMAELSRLLAGVLSHHEVLPRMAEAAAKSVGGRRARVTLFLPPSSAQVCRWPVDATDESPYELTVSVVHQGETVGEIAVAKASGEKAGSAEEALLADLAAQAGVAMSNLRLTAELRKRLEDLKASRRRIVAAQDLERRRIERNLHDGAQQQVVALFSGLRLARNRLARGLEVSDATLAELQAQAHLVLEDIRELAQGIHPTVLTDRGLVEAIEARAARVPLGVAIHASPGLRDTRYSEEVEAGVYFVVSEGLANILKHAGATQISISLAAADGVLEVELADDGCGFEPKAAAGSGLKGLEDRVEALGGTLAITSTPGAGAVLRARIGARPGPRSSGPACAAIRQVMASTTDAPSVG